MNDQIVELPPPGLQILLYSPAQVSELEDGCDYARRFPDGKDLVDYVNECRLGAFGVRWPAREYWLHVSDTMDQSVIARASDHVRFGLEVRGGLMCIRGSDDLFRWTRRCRDEQLVSLADGVYAVTACMIPYDGGGPVRIYIHLAPTPARPDIGFHRVPDLYGESPIY